MPPTDPLKIVGTTLAEKYAVDALVNEGHVAVVYAARNLVWDIPVAIRAVTVVGDLAPAERQKLYHRMVQDGAVLHELSDRAPAICRTRDVGTLTTPGGVWIPYVVSEWLDGITLDDAMAEASDRGDAPRSPAGAALLLEPIALGLALAHQAGLVHHNINPANVLLVADDTGALRSARLLDLGVGRIVEQSRLLHAGSASAPSLFVAAYAAPEQLRGDHAAVGPWSDVFALAAVMLELMGARRDVSSAVVPTPRALGLDVNDAVEQVFAKALATDVSARYADAGAMWSALRRAMRMESVPAPRWERPGGVPSDPGDLRRSSRPPPSLSTPASGILALTLSPVVPRSIPAPVTPDAPRITQAPVPLPPSRRGVWAGATIGAALVACAAAFVATRHDPAPALAELPRVEPVLASAARTGCPDGMITIPGGGFFMGSDDDLELERPAHSVKLRPYCVDRYEVTTAAYKSCSDAGRCKRAGAANEWPGITAAERDAYDAVCNGNDPVERGTHPINCVTWAMASVYCVAHGTRLPTEAEWELAARGPDGRRYPWGDDEPTATRLNACGKECQAWSTTRHLKTSSLFDVDDGWANTAPVGSFPQGASRYGVEDIVGNVAEWVQDWHAPYGADAQRDPRGPATGEKRVVRGGAWNGANASWVRPSFRFAMTPDTRSHGVGFRCARDF
jgi:formylglycine-generating enzyme required for sulfatase activity